MYIVLLIAPVVLSSLHPFHPWKFSQEGVFLFVSFSLSPTQL